MMFSEFFTKTTEHGEEETQGSKFKKGDQRTRPRLLSGQTGGKYGAGSSLGGVGVAKVGLKQADKKLGVKEFRNLERDKSNRKIFERLKKDRFDSSKFSNKMRTSGGAGTGMIRHSNYDTRRIRSSDKDSRKISRMMKKMSKAVEKKYRRKKKDKVSFGDGGGNEGASKKSRLRYFKDIVTRDSKLNLPAHSSQYLTRLERNHSQGDINRAEANEGKKGGNGGCGAADRVKTGLVAHKSGKLGNSSISKSKNRRKKGAGHHHLHHLNKDRKKSLKRGNFSKKHGGVSSLKKSQKLPPQKKVDLEFISCVKHNKMDKCLDLISPERKIKANLNAAFENDWTALHFACWKENYKIVSLLLLNGADVNKVARNDLTPLMVACSIGNDKIVRILLNAHADTKPRDGGGNTSLHYAAKSGVISCIKILVQDHLKVNFKNKNNIGMTPLDLAPNKECKEFLLKQERLKEQREHETLVRIHKYRKENFALLRGERKLELSHHDSSSTSRSDCDAESSTTDSERLGPHHFMVHSLIGRGSFGEVYLVERKETGGFYAMKVLDKDKIISKCQNLIFLNFVIFRIFLNLF